VARNDTVLVVVDESQPGMMGMVVACVLLLFSFHDAYLNQTLPCALVNWFIRHGDEWDKDTNMWVVWLEYEGNRRTLDVIHLDSIVCGAHLLPCFSTGFLPEDFDHTFALDVFKSYFINQHIDHHMHEFLMSPSGTF